MQAELDQRGEEAIDEVLAASPWSEPGLREHLEEGKTLGPLAVIYLAELGEKEIVWARGRCGGETQTGLGEGGISKREVGDRWAWRSLKAFALGKA
ncbi:MAG: hypothetical protein ACJAVK_003635 [Akkermansiaceae bacterium]|jgi:hypothetical protein